MFNKHRPKEPSGTHELDSHAWQSTYIHLCHNKRVWEDFCLAQWFVYLHMYLHWYSSLFEHLLSIYDQFN